jgi:hypothetical protein
MNGIHQKKPLGFAPGAGLEIYFELPGYEHSYLTLSSYTGLNLNLKVQSKELCILFILLTDFHHF